MGLLGAVGCVILVDLSLLVLKKVGDVPFENNLVITERATSVETNQTIAIKLNQVDDGTITTSGAFDAKRFPTIAHVSSPRESFISCAFVQSPVRGRR